MLLYEVAQNIFKIAKQYAELNVKMGYLKQES